MPWLGQELTLEQFVERYERPRIPVVITGLTDGWAAAQAWTPAALRARFGEHRFKASFSIHPDDCATFSRFDFC